MNYASIIIPFVGGLGMFIYGMQIMAQGLENAAGSRMKSLLEALTKNKLFGVMLGAFITAVIQSSSATTVMVVGFVNAGIMNLSQAMGVIMGANIGTTVTGWLVSSVEWAKFLSPANLAPIAIIIGVIIMLTGKRRSSKDISSIIVGFGILFVGITTMSSAVAPLQESEAFCSIFVKLGHNPFLGILAGALVTAIIQSSSASVGILQSLAAAGLVPFNAAVYIIMGQNIGTCVTAIMSSIGAKKTAKTAAIMHLLFNVIGTIIFSVAAIFFFKVLNPGMGAGMITQTGQREYDEHLWTSPVCAKKIVSIIEEKLCDADKENADYYKKNAKKYIKKLEDVDYELREVSENAGIKHLIFADGFSMRYMASELGLAYSAAYPVCGGYQKPKKQTISYLEERIKEEKIPVIFKSENDKSDVAEKIAKKTGAKVEVFNTCHMVSAKQLKNGVSYIELMNENIKLLKKALKFKG